MVQPVLIRPIPCLQHHHGLARNDATRVTGTRSSSACLSTALSVCLPAYLYVHLSACPSICMSGCKSIQADAAACLSSLSVRPVRLSVYLSICLPISLPICPSVCLSVRAVRAVYLSTREMGHTIQRYRTETGTTVPREECRRVRMYQG